MQIFDIRRLLKSFGVSSWLLLGALLFTILATSSTVPAQVVLSVSIAPPVLPVYAQPVCPGDGYIWTPGYWSYSDDGGYYWVPGAWVEPPEVGLLWTPGYWGWNDNVYVWNAGYWGPQVGFYGGINYGFGYIGTGYAGGYWRDRHFFYNSRVNNVDVHVIHNVYQKTVVEHRTYVSYNGGRGGINARPTAEQERFTHEHHVERTAAQEQHANAARSDRSQFASENHGHPAVAATPKPGEFRGAGVVQAKGSASDRSTTTRNETKSAAKPRTEGTTHTESTTRTETKPAATPRTATKPAATHEPKTETTPRTETKPAPAHETKPAPTPRAETKPAPVHESKPAPVHESKPAAAPRTEAKPAPTHETKTESKPPTETKPAATHESKPPAQHESAPREEKPPKN